MAGILHSESLEDLAVGGLFTDGDWVESKDQDPAGGVRLTQLADVGVGEFRDRSDRWMREDQASRLRCTFLRPGDVLIARMPDPIGRACLMPDGIGPAVTAVDVAILRIARADVEPRYVMWALNSPAVHHRIVSMQSGTTRKRISRKNLAVVTLPIPVAEEQRRIVAILEEHLSDLGDGERALATALRRLAGLRERRVLAALTGGAGVNRLAPSINPAGTRDGDLPALPVGWEWKRLGEVADVVGGVTKDSKKQSDLSVPEVPYLRVANVQRGRLDLRSIATIRVPEARARALTLEPGDVLLNEGGDRDKLARGWVWEGQIEGCVHQNHVFRARVTERRLDPYFVSLTTNSFGASWAEQNGKQSVNLASISLSMIRKMPVIVPPDGVAGRLVREIRDEAESLDRVQTAVAQASTRSARLRRALLAAAFAGRLTGRGSDTDVIEELDGRSPHDS